MDSEENALYEYRKWLRSNGFVISLDPWDGSHSGSYVTGARRFLAFLKIAQKSDYVGKHRKEAE